MNPWIRLLTFPIRWPLNIMSGVASDLMEPRAVEFCTFAFNQPGKNSQPGPLGFNQLRWCDEHFGKFQGFAVMRKQAEAARAK